jgi:glyceraldehyde 3-phosphate dehydrogenase
MKIAINGFGRIGRATAKILFDKPDLELVAINDLTDTKTLSHLLKYDSVYGVWEHQVEADENSITIDGKKIAVFAEKDPSSLPWRDLEVDVVVESTGHFLDQASCQVHLTAGAKKVVISAPAKDPETKTFVLGVNHKEYAGETIISNASCTTNCIAPIMKVLEEKLGVAKSMMTTVHSYTADQVLVDGPHKDLRRARSAAINIVPTTTGAAKATALTIPSLKDHFDGLSIRVPSPVVSLSDITAVIKRTTTVEQLNSILKEAADRDLKGIIEYSTEELVSSDLRQNPFSAIIDSKLTQVIDGDLVKIIAWYDNEYGYSCRLVEMVEYIGRSK